MGQAVIGGVITSSLLTLVVVPVIYCYLDDLGLGGASSVAACAGSSRGLDPCEIKCAVTCRTSLEMTMNIEQARFNMIEQQIRPGTCSTRRCWRC